MVVGYSQQYNVEENPTVKLYAYIIRHGEASKQRQKTRCAWIQLNFVTLGLGLDGYQYYSYKYTTVTVFSLWKRKREVGTYDGSS